MDLISNFIFGPKDKSQKASLCAAIEKALHSNDFTLGEKLYAAARHPAPRDLANKMLDFNFREKCTVEVTNQDNRKAKLHSAEVILALLPFISVESTEGQRAEICASAQKAVTLLSSTAQDKGTITPFLLKGNAAPNSYCQHLRTKLSFARGSFYVLLDIFRNHFEVIQDKKDIRSVVPPLRQQEVPPIASNPNQAFLSVSSLLPAHASSLSDLMLWLSTVAATLEGDASHDDLRAALIEGASSASSFPKDGLGEGFDEEAIAKAAKSKNRREASAPALVYPIVDHFVIFHTFLCCSSVSTMRAGVCVRACCRGLSSAASLNLRMAVLTIMGFQIRNNAELEWRFGRGVTMKAFLEMVSTSVYGVFEAAELSLDRKHLLNKEECNLLSAEIKYLMPLHKEAFSPKYTDSALQCLSREEGPAEVVQGCFLSSLAFLLIFDDLFTTYPERIATQTACGFLSLLLNPMFTNDKKVGLKTQVLLAKRVFCRRGNGSPSEEQALRKFILLLHDPNVIKTIRDSPVATRLVSERLPDVVNSLRKDGGPLVISNPELLLCFSLEARSRMLISESARVPAVKLLSEFKSPQWRGVFVEKPFEVLLPFNNDEAESLLKELMKIDFSPLEFDGVPIVTKVKDSLVFSPSSALLFSVVESVSFASLASTQLICERVSLGVKSLTETLGWVNGEVTEKEMSKCLHNLLKFALIAEALSESRYSRILDALVLSVRNIESVPSLKRLKMASVSESPVFSFLNDEHNKDFYFPNATILQTKENEMNGLIKRKEQFAVDSQPKEWLTFALDTPLDPLSKFCMKETNGLMLSSTTIEQYRQVKEICMNACDEVRKIIGTFPQMDAVWEWLENVRADLRGSAVSSLVFEPLSGRVERIRGLRGAPQTLRNIVALKKEYAALRVALHQGIPSLQFLFVDQIAGSKYFSAILYGYLLAGLSDGIDILNAIKNASQSFEYFIESPLDFSLNGYTLRVLRVEDEVSLLRSYWKKRGMSEEEDVITFLNRIHVQEILKTSRSLLSMSGLSMSKSRAGASNEDRHGKWPESVLAVLENVSAETLRLWKCVLEIPAFITSMQSVIQFAMPNRDITNLTADEIAKITDLLCTNTIDSVLERMRGMVGAGSDASYDVLQAFRYYVPFLTALLLTDNNTAFTLTSRIELLCDAHRFSVEPQALSDKVVRMLGENIGDVKRIIEIEGSTSETGKIRIELSLLRDDPNACLAICVCPNVSHLAANQVGDDPSIEGAASIATAVGKDSSTGRQFPNISVRLFASSERNGGIPKEMHADDRLTAFEERVVMISDEAIAHNFCQLWRLAQSLLPFVSDAQWLGLVKGSVDDPCGQTNFLSNLPLRPSDGKGAFYCIYLPLNVSIRERNEVQDDYIGVLKSFIAKRVQAQSLGKESADHDTLEKWSLLFPRQLTNEILARGRNSGDNRISLDVIKLVKKFLDLSGIDTRAHLDASVLNVPLGDDDEDGVRYSTVTYSALKSFVLGSEGYKALFDVKLKTKDRVLRVVNYAFTSRSSSPASKFPAPVYFGEALQFAISKYSHWSPRPFEMLWCTPDTSLLDVMRFVAVMAAFPAAVYTIIGVDCLKPVVFQELLKCLRSAGSGSSPLTILTGAGEEGVDQTMASLGGAANLVADLGTLEPPKKTAHRNVLGNKCTFVTGGFQSGKSYFIAGKGASTALPHTGDAIDLGMVLNFLETNTNTKVWVDINAYMVSPTPRDPYKLMRLNHVLLMLLMFRVVVDDRSGAIVDVDDSVEFFVEVPPHMMLEKKDIPNKVLVSPLAMLGACSHIGHTELVTSSFDSFSFGDRHRKVATLLELAMAPETGFDNEWRPHMDPKKVIVKALATGLIPRALLFLEGDNTTMLKSQGVMANFLEILYCRFESVVEEIKAGEPATLALCLRAVVEQVCKRFAPESQISKKHLLPNQSDFLFLPLTKTFEYYPLSVTPDVASFGQHCDPDARRAEISDVLKKVREHGQLLERNSVKQKDSSSSLCRRINSFKSVSESDVSLCHVMTGKRDVRDVMDLLDGLDGLNFIKVDDMILRCLHLVERQRARLPLIVQGSTGVGKSYLLSIIFRLQIQYAVRKARDIVIKFILNEVVNQERRESAVLFSDRLKKAGGPTDFNSAVIGWDDYYESTCWYTLYGPLETLPGRLQQIMDDMNLCDGFYQRYDRMKEALADYPVLIYPSEPECMTTAPKGFGDQKAIVHMFAELLSNVIPHEYKLVAHPDTHRADIIRLLDGPLRLANALGASRDTRVRSLVVPVVYDECNTLVETAGLLKTVMGDMRLPLHGIDKGFCRNVWFVGAINKKSDKYVTQHLHPSLENSVCIFEGISENDQKRSYIEQSISRCAEFLMDSKFEKLKKQLVDIVFDVNKKSENLVSTGKTRHVVSQREFHKVDSVIRAMNALVQQCYTDEADSHVAVGDRDLDLVRICVTAVYYVFVARIREVDVRQELKRSLDSLCANKDGEIAKYYFSDEAESGKSISDAARRNIIQKVIKGTHSQHFEFQSGVALTDTLQENMFLTLLACVSQKKHKLSLAIIGDSGMGKTLSNRLVERNLRGVSSKTSFCAHLPKATFFYIQGASTTTSDQVSRVCDRAQEEQMKNSNGCNIVSFDEASLPEKENLVQKSLHQPVDRCVVSIIVLSNKPFDDEANQNRFLVVWNESLDENEVNELTAGCLGIKYFSRAEDGKCPYWPIVSGLTKSYFEIRENENLKSLQMRDYVYLLKYLAGAGPNGQFSAIHLKEGIELNYGIRHQGGLSEAIEIFFRNVKNCYAKSGKADLWETCLTPEPVAAIIRRSYARYKEGGVSGVRPRFKLLIDPNDSYSVSDRMITMIRQVATESNPRQAIVNITVSELEGERSRLFDAKILSKLRMAMEKGDHVVIRNPERLLSYLFDVLNLNFTSFIDKDNKEHERAIVALGAETHLFDIDKLFLITFVFNEKTIRRLEKENVPFLSRCEKYLLEVDFDAKFCEPVSVFANDFIGTGDISIFNDKITVTSAVSSSAEGLGTENTVKSQMDPEHVFRSNCKLLSLVSPSAFLRVSPKLIRRSDYTAIYLKQCHFSIHEVIKKAAYKTCTFVTVSDIVSINTALKGLPARGDVGLDVLSDNVDADVIDVDMLESFEALTVALRKRCEESNGPPIALVVTSKLRENVDFMWALRNEVSDCSQDCSRPFIIISGMPCKATAIFSDRWSYIHLDTCNSSQEARILLKFYLNQNTSDSRPFDAFDVNTVNIILKKITNIFCNSYQPLPHTRYNSDTDKLKTMRACTEVTFVRETLLRLLNEAISPDHVSSIVNSSISKSRTTGQPFMTVLHSQSRIAFYESVCPALELLAGSSFPYLLSEMKGESRDLLKESMEAYCVYVNRISSKSTETSDGTVSSPSRTIQGFPRQGEYRESASAWLFPLAWHAVTHADLHVVKKHDLALFLDACARSFEGLPFSKISVRSVSMRERILLDVLQQCGFIPIEATVSASEDGGRSTSAYRLFESSTLRGLDGLADTYVWGGKAPEMGSSAGFFKMLALATVIGLGTIFKSCRQEMMGDIFVRFTEKILVKGDSKSVLDGSTKSFLDLIFSAKDEDSEQSSFCYSLLFSFLFRSESTESLNIPPKGTLGVLSLLSDLDDTLLNGFGPHAALQRLSEKLKSSTGGILTLSLKVVDECLGVSLPQNQGRRLSISSLTWYLTLLRSGRVFSKKESAAKQTHFISDVAYWATSGAKRPFYWTVLEVLIDGLFENQCKTEDISAQVDSNAVDLLRGFFNVTVTAACELVKGLSLNTKDIEDLSDITVIDQFRSGMNLRNFVLGRITERFRLILSTFKTSKSALFAVEKSMERNLPKLVVAALLAASCIRIPVKMDEAVGAIKFLPRISGFPFNYESLIQNNELPEVFDIRPFHLLLAYFTRKHGLEKTRELIRDGLMGPQPIAPFAQCSSQTSDALAQLAYCQPPSISNESAYAEVMRSINEGKDFANADAKTRRLVLHALRQDVFLTQVADEKYSEEKRIVFKKVRDAIDTQKQPCSWHPLALKAFDFLLNPIDEVALKVYRGWGVAGNEGNGDVEGWLRPDPADILRASIVSFVMVEGVSRLQNNNNSPRDFWEALILTPRCFKGHCTFGDMFGSIYLIHGFDCGALYELSGERKSNPVASMPELVHQYSLFALIYAVSLSYCLLEPANSDKLSEHTITNTLINSVVAGDRVPLGQKVAVAAAFSLSQHLSFLSKKCSYTDHGTCLHLMELFLLTLASPPPVRGVESGGKSAYEVIEGYHSAFGQMVPAVDAINAKLREITRQVESTKWASEVTDLSACLPGLDLPIVQRDVSTSSDAASPFQAHLTFFKGVLTLYNKAFSVAQTAPRLGHLYRLLPELALRLPLGIDPYAVTFEDMAKLSEERSSVIMGGMQAFNKLLRLNGGQLAVECGAEELDEITKDTAIQEYVTKNTSDPRFKDLDRTNSQGQILHAFEAIRSQIPTINALESTFSELKAFEGFSASTVKAILERVARLAGRDEMMTECATFWGMSKAVTGPMQTFENVPFGVLDTLCKESIYASYFPSPTQNEIHIACQQLLAAIINFFVVPSMQIKVSTTNIENVFHFPKPTCSVESTSSEAQAKIESVAEDVKSLAKECLAARSALYDVDWPFKEPQSKFCSALGQEFSTDLHFASNFLEATRCVLKDLPSNLFGASAPLMGRPEFQEESLAVRLSAALPCEEGIALNIEHLPRLSLAVLDELSGTLSNRYQAGAFEQIKVSAYHEALPDGAYYSLLNNLKAQDNSISLGKQLCDEITLYAVDGNAGPDDDMLSFFRDTICFEELVPLFDGISGVPLRFAHAAHTVAAVRKMIEEELREVHEDRTRDRLYGLDKPLCERIGAGSGEHAQGDLTSDDFRREGGFADEDEEDDVTAMTGSTVRYGESRVAFDEFVESDRWDGQWASQNSEGIAKLRALARAFIQRRRYALVVEEVHSSVGLRPFAERLFEKGASEIPLPSAADSVAFAFLEPKGDGYFRVVKVTQTPKAALTKTFMMPSLTSHLKGSIVVERHGRVLTDGDRVAKGAVGGVVFVLPKLYEGAPLEVYGILPGSEKKSKFPMCEYANVSDVCMVVKSALPALGIIGLFSPKDMNKPLHPEMMVYELKKKGKTLTSTNFVAKEYKYPFNDPVFIQTRRGEECHRCVVSLSGTVSFPSSFGETETEPIPVAPLVSAYYHFTSDPRFLCREPSRMVRPPVLVVNAHTMCLVDNGRTVPIKAAGAEAAREEYIFSVNAFDVSGQSVVSGHSLFVGCVMPSSVAAVPALRRAVSDRYRSGVPVLLMTAAGRVLGDDEVVAHRSTGLIAYVFPSCESADSASFEALRRDVTVPVTITDGFSPDRTRQRWVFTKDASVQNLMKEIAFNREGTKSEETRLLWNGVDVLSYLDFARLGTLIAAMGDGHRGWVAPPMRNAIRKLRSTPESDVKDLFGEDEDGDQDEDLSVHTEEQQALHFDLRPLCLEGVKTCAIEIADMETFEVLTFPSKSDLNVTPSVPLGSLAKALVSLSFGLPPTLLNGAFVFDRDEGKTGRIFISKQMEVDGKDTIFVHPQKLLEKRVDFPKLFEFSDLSSSAEPQSRVSQVEIFSDDLLGRAALSRQHRNEVNTLVEDIARVSYSVLRRLEGDVVITDVA